jgi:hypothetical protein
LTVVFTAMAAVAAPGASASDGLGVEARAGFGVGSMLSQWQRDQGYEAGFVPDLRPGLRLDSSMAAELAVANWSFPRVDGGTGRATLLGAGARWDPRLVRWLTWFLDGHAGIALTGPVNRFMLDVGTGFDVWATPNLAFGLFVRYGQIVDPGVDPRFWAAGLGATVAWASGPPPPDPAALEKANRQRAWELARERERRQDRDHDGVADEVDTCPDEPAGSRPDSSRRGCPRPERQSVRRAEASAAAADRDRDGVPDRQDNCPDRPFGEHPDPMSMGCPLSDGDRDGIPDILDACPKKPGKPSPKERRNGCTLGTSLPRARPAPSCGSDAST